MDAGEIRDWLKNREYYKVKEYLAGLNEVDLAQLLEEFPEKEQIMLFRLIRKEDAAEVFSNMEPWMQESLIRAFTITELKEVINDMYLDDTVDLLEEMPANAVDKILQAADAQTRDSINKLLKYPKDSAGSIMTIEYVDLKKAMTVEEAFHRIRSTGVDKETIYTCYVTDSDRKLEGLVTVKELLLSPKTAIIGDIMQTHVIAASTMDDKEEVANQLQKYDFLALPVVDQEYRLVGIVTFDDAMDVLQEENTEDIEMMAAITPTGKPYLKTSTIDLWKKRVPWLLLLMVSATFTGKIIQAYESALAAQVVLTAFIPMLMDTGGNAGSQASVTIIRGLSLGEIQMIDIFKIIWKEIRVAFLCGLTLSLANFAKMMLLDRVGLSVALIVCLTLVVTVIIAKITGCTLPILAKRIGFDPAVMASPFITTIVDALSLIVYFNFASMLLH